MPDQFCHCFLFLHLSIHHFSKPLSTETSRAKYVTVLQSMSFTCKCGKNFENRFMNKIFCRKIILNGAFSIVKNVPMPSNFSHRKEKLSNGHFFV